MADSPQVQLLPGLVEDGFADLRADAAAADPAVAAHPAAAVQDVPSTATASAACCTSCTFP